MAKAGSSSPLISVVVRTRDRQSLLREALQSIEAQTHRPLEVVVVNDGGGPVHQEAEAVAKDVRVSLVEHSHPRGRAAALNAGVAAATGSWIAFLDDDDLFLPQHLAVLWNTLRAANANVAYAGCRLVRIDSGEEETFATPFDRDLLALANFIPICAVLVARSSLLEVGGFDESLSFLEDWDMWLRLASSHEFAFCPEITCIYRVRPGSVGGDMAPERWAAFGAVLAKHWGSIRPNQVAARLWQLERAVDEGRRRLWEQQAELVRLREENRFVHELAEAHLLGPVWWLHRLWRGWQKWRGIGARGATRR